MNFSYFCTNFREKKMRIIIKNIIVVAMLCVVSVVYSQSANYYMQKAKKGDPTAQMFLALCYQQGKGVEKNDSLAVYWLERSSRQGLSESQVLLGHCYREGRGVKADSTKAFELYENASWSESSLSFDALGDCYYYGIGTTRDVIRSRYYYSKAAKRGYKKSKLKYEKIRFKKDEDAVIDL